jgi:hypothetical protein
MKISKVSITLIIALVLIGIWATKKLVTKPKLSTKTKILKIEGASHWTCPMHPQIHLDHAGECPICHMKLVLVKAQQAEAANHVSDARAVVNATNAQLSLQGVQKYSVEKMSIRLNIPVSGRFISSKTVAFQIYETDLRYVKNGLSFKGVSNFSLEDELTGTISSVDSVVDPTSQTVRVVGQIKKGLSNAPSESGFRGDIQIDLKDRVAIPESSVLHTGAGDFVYLFSDGNKLTPQLVKLGQKSEGFYEVLSGIEPGQIISLGPNFLIDSESKIQAIATPEEENGTTNSEPKGSSSKKRLLPSCPKGEHWDTPMSMCMPGQG